jgi:hypothetical protein
MPPSDDAAPRLRPRALLVAIAGVLIVLSLRLPGRRRMPPGDLVRSGATIYLRHEERGGRHGFAPYHPHAQKFRCATCGYRKRRTDVRRSCDGFGRCDQPMVFDGRDGWACANGHRLPVETWDGGG